MLSQHPIPLIHVQHMRVFFSNVHASKMTALKREITIIFFQNNFSLQNCFENYLQKFERNFLLIVFNVVLFLFLFIFLFFSFVKMVCFFKEGGVHQFDGISISLTDIFRPFRMTDIENLFEPCCIE